MTTIQDQISLIRQDFDRELAALQRAPEARVVEEFRVAYLGKKGRVTLLFELLRSAAPEERKDLGKSINDIRSHCESSFAGLLEASKAHALQAELENTGMDITRPALVLGRSGSLHPVTLMRRYLLAEFSKLGFTAYEGPDIDLDFYNFSALNFPDDHPARDMHDTFFLGNVANTVLRTHTTNLEVHAMLDERPPFRIVATGRTFRCDSDLTHTPMFHQIEAFIVDHSISFAHMKTVIDVFLKGVFGSDIHTRLRPSFFPFVEPGAEVDMQCVSCRGKGCRLCKNTGWLEIGGCGMLHPNVFEAVGYDSEDWSGFAFGFGIDRMAMLKYHLTDLRQLFSGDAAFFSQFPIHV